MENVVPKLHKQGGQLVYRAKFSSVTAGDIEKAMRTLGEPNEVRASTLKEMEFFDTSFACHLFTASHFILWLFSSG